jgi:hypothetical protein
VLNAIRFALAAFFDPAIPDLMAASRLHAVSLLLMTGVHIFVMLGLLLLNFLRVEQDLKGSLDEIRILRGIIPICSACKKVRDDHGAWKQIESYIRDHSEAQFSHGICLTVRTVCTRTITTRRTTFFDAEAEFPNNNHI